VSIEAARREYGVVITGAGAGADLSVDDAATRRLRATQSQSELPGPSRPQERPSP
jgi:hypothetical protein